MKFLKTIISTLFISSVLTTYGQNKIDTTRVLELKELANYSEGNFFWRDSSIILRQETTYNDPNIIDEEFSQLLKIRFIPGLLLTEGKTFDLERDSAMVKCTYDRLSVWNWSKKKTSLTGQITVLSVTKRKIALKLDIYVTETDKAIHIYKGIRMFKKSKPLERYSYDLTAGNNRFAAMLADVVTIGCKSLSASVSARRLIFSFSS